MQNIPRLSSIIEQLKLRQDNIISVELAVGELIPFSDELIHALWSESSLARSTLVIRRMPAEHQCMLCFEKYHPLNKETSCPHCGGVGAKVIAGEEFRLLSVNGESK
ncbi:MAG: hydrogenase maturation nickel metallochaperone HypA [Chloroflexi bacterium]|nr:hydrogenase maturation nickel metallochaperone HypA [Chloroflexota bacterium]